MKFPLGKEVVFISPEGEQVVARPFYFKPGNSQTIQMDLYMADGIPIRPVDEKEGVYTLGETGVTLRLRRK